MDSEAVFLEMATQEEDNQLVVTRESFNKYLQNNGVCFSSRLTDSFLRRFCRLSPDLVLQLDQFKPALLDYRGSAPAAVSA